MSEQWTPPASPTPSGQPPPNYLIPAILTTIFCCPPLGIVSIVFAAQVNGKYQAGDITGAQESSRKAKLFAMIAAGIGVVGYLIAIILNVGVIMSGGMG